MRYELALEATHNDTFCLKHTQLLKKITHKKGYFFSDEVKKCWFKLKLHSETAGPLYIRLNHQ